jgi:methylmalonyl-CoA mutase
MNVQRILKEEAHADRVADPAGGAYYIESLTHALAHEAWKLFQQMDAGAITIDAVVGQARADKQKAVESRRKTMVGVNNYPDLNETIDEPLHVPKDIWRAPAVFETLRLRTENHARRTGRRPKILLLERGDLKMRQARSQFCQNLFGCGGFAIEVAGDYNGTDADLIVLCSSDPEYAALAQEVCPHVQQPVVVAGNPKDGREEMNAAGVQGFVHVLSNAVETITQWQNRLGIPAVGKE